MRYGVRGVIIKVLAMTVLLYLFSVPIAYITSFSMWGTYILMFVRLLLIINFSVIIHKKCQAVLFSNESKRKKCLRVFLACDILAICLHFSNATAKLYGTISAMFRIYSSDTPVFLLIVWEQLLGRGLYWSILLSFTIVFFNWKQLFNKHDSLEIEKACHN